MDRPLISIIVPVYKAEKYLTKCVESILDQTYTNFELILVDDGSPDRCPDLCDKFAKQDSRIIVIHKENGGVSEARNVALDAAKGDYIGFVDSDDYIANNMYQVLLEKIQKNDADLAMCNYDRVSNRYETIYSISSLPDICITPDSCIEITHGKWEGGVFDVLWNKLYKRYLFDEIRIPVGRRYEDAYVSHHILYKCKKVVCVRDSLYFYMQNFDGFMLSEQSVKSMDLGDALLDRYSFAKKIKNKQLKDCAVLELSYKMEQWLYLSKKDDECRKKYMELRRKSFFLLYEKAAWRDYNIRGRLYHRCELLFPNVFNKSTINNSRV